jgi:16S rRNA A1518/A1519 N6-dimethyltransferase RsmA/KsgA/DIM1 with predicted DNA glycosylase/AP lyase activity
VNRRRPGGLPRPRKRFGQHFLTDGSVLQEIAERVDPEPTDLVL